MEGYKKKMYDNVTDRCDEMFVALDKLRAEMALSRSSINRQNGYNAQTDKALDMHQANVVNSMAEMKQRAWDFEEKVDKTLMESRNTQNRKMYKFVEILIREFKYLNQVAEDKILAKVGFYERFRDPLAKKRLNLGYLYDEIHSAGSAPSFSFLKD